MYGLCVIPCGKLHYLYLVFIIKEAVPPTLPEETFPGLERVAVALLAAVRGHLSVGVKGCCKPYQGYVIHATFAYAFAFKDVNSENLI